MQTKPVFTHWDRSIAPTLSPGGQPAVAPAAADGPESLLLVAAASDAALYSAGAFARLRAHTTADAVRLLETARPRLVVVDWDTPDVDGADICRAAARNGSPRVLVTTSRIDQVPAALKCGCHAVLLKPFAPPLLAGRIGRLLRESVPSGPHRTVAAWRTGTNRVWPGTACPKCGTDGATSFDYSSHRRMWYACLKCEFVWLGARQE